jgi:hypothetical protein
MVTSPDCRGVGLFRAQAQGGSELSVHQYLFCCFFATVHRGKRLADSPRALPSRTSLECSPSPSLPSGFLPSVSSPRRTSPRVRSRRSTSGQAGQALRPPSPCGDLRRGSASSSRRSTSGQAGRACSSNCFPVPFFSSIQCRHRDDAGRTPGESHSPAPSPFDVPPLAKGVQGAFDGLGDGA